MKKHVFPIIMIGMTLLAWIIAFPILPSEVPIHWGIDGVANGFATKFHAMFLLVGIMVFMYAMLVFLPNIDPRKENYKFFTKGYSIIVYSLLAIFFALNIVTLLIGLGVNIPMSYIGMITVGVIFIIIGNFLQQIRSNFFIGIRTPWTLSSDMVWKKTHRFSGKLFFIAGVVLICSAFAPAKWAEFLVFAVIIITVITPFLYSYLLFKKEIKNR